MGFDTRRMLGLAEDRLRRGQVDGAIQSLVELLSVEPDDADAHAMLALCLVRRQRLHAAELEAAIALRLEPESAFAHIALAAVLIARRRFATAESHLLHALELDPSSSSCQRYLAALYSLWERPDEARVRIESACALAPDDIENLSMRGKLALDSGDRDGAERFANEALEIDAAHVDAIVLIGKVELARGNIDEARSHAVWALQNEPQDVGALTLLAGVKARSSLLLGLWWRFQSFVAGGRGTRTVMLLLTFYVVYRVLDIAFRDAGHADWADILTYAWLGFCAYTWFAPMLFVRALRKEMVQVRMRPDF